MGNQRRLHQRHKMQLVLKNPWEGILTKYNSFEVHKGEGERKKEEEIGQEE